MGEESPLTEECPTDFSGTLDALDMSVPVMTRQDSSASFCSALSGSSSPRSDHNATEQDLLQAPPTTPSHFGLPEVLATSTPAQSSQAQPDALNHVDTLPVPLVGTSSSEERNGHLCSLAAGVDGESLPG